MKTRQRLKSKIVRIRTSKTDTRYFLVERYYAYAVYLNRYLFEPKFHIYQKAPSQVKTEETVTCFDSKSYNTVTNFNHLLYTPYSKCTDRAGRVYQRFINHLKKGYLIPLALEYNEMLDETTLERAETMPTGRLYVLHVPTETDGTYEESEVLMPVATYVALLLGPDFYKLKEFPQWFQHLRTALDDVNLLDWFLKLNIRKHFSLHDFDGYERADEGHPANAIILKDGFDNTVAIYSDCTDSKYKFIDARHISSLFVMFEQKNSDLDWQETEFFLQKSYVVENTLILSFLGPEIHLLLSVLQLLHGCNSRNLMTNDLMTESVYSTPNGAFDFPASTRVHLHVGISDFINNFSEMSSITLAYKNKVSLRTSLDDMLDFVYLTTLKQDSVPNTQFYLETLEYLLKTCDTAEELKDKFVQLMKEYQQKLLDKIEGEN